jgi:hypothetical protein
MAGVAGDGGASAAGVTAGYGSPALFNPFEGGEGGEHPLGIVMASGARGSLINLIYGAEQLKLELAIWARILI